MSGQNGYWVNRSGIGFAVELISTEGRDGDPGPRGNTVADRQGLSNR